MKSAIALLLLACGMAAAAEPDFRVSNDRSLVAPMPVHWLQLYSVSPFKQFWSLTAEVKNLDKDVEKVLKIFEKAGASLTVPLTQSIISETDRSRQLSYRLPVKNAKAALQELKKVAQFGEPLVRPGGEPVPIAEVKEKIAKLIGDKKEHGAALAKMSAVGALVDELLEHLLLVEHMREKAEAEVLLNMTVREKRP